MRFLIGLITVILALAPYWLVAVAFVSRPIGRMWYDHGTRASIVLAAAAILSRVLMCFLPSDVGTFGNSIAYFLTSIDMLLLSPLESFCETLAGKQTGMPAFAMITYGLVIYFCFYRVLGWLLSGSGDVATNHRASDEKHLDTGLKHW